jgi:hypothetical protein
MRQSPITVIFAGLSAAPSATVMLTIAVNPLSLMRSSMLEQADISVFEAKKHCAGK